MKFVASLAVLFAVNVAYAAPRWVTIPSPAGNGDIPVYIDEQPDAVATVVLVPGGPFTVGERDPQSGKPKGINFLVRTVDTFAAQKLNVVLMDKPSQAGDLRWGNNRQSDAHGKDVLKVVETAKQLDKPVWLVGTSLGAISVAKASLLDETGLVNGVVLSSSVFHAKGGSGVMTMDYGKLSIPVLISHHQKDECPETNPQVIKDLVSKLTASKKVEVAMITAGDTPKGNVCGPNHWHGFINAEDETVKSISSFIHKN